MPATLLPPAAVLVAAALVLLGGIAGTPALVAAVIVVQMTLAYGVPAGEPRTDRIRTGVLALVAGVVAAIVLALDNSGLDTSADAPGGSIGPIAYVVGPAVILALLLQLARREHDQMVDRLATAVSAVALAGMLAAWVELLVLGGDIGDQLVLLGAGCALLTVFPGLGLDPGARRGAAWWAVKLLAVAAAAALAISDPAGVGIGSSVAIGAATGACGLLGAEVAVRVVDKPLARALLTPAIALAFAGPVAYLVTRIVLT